MLVFNLTEYLRNEFPTEKFYPELAIKEATEDYQPDRRAILRMSGGSEAPWFRYVVSSIQVLCRDIDGPKAYAFAFKIYEKITSRFGLILPQITVDGILYPEFQTAQISANQEPFGLGCDSAGRVEYTCNYSIIYRR